jgi:Uncharacterized conserved protein related to C-terminal domain of eukaryotic chaperone, SACSIN
MATWQEMSIDCRDAAKDLLAANRYRSSISRSYYAAYCAVTGALEGVVDFAHAGNNPAHEVLANLILNNLYDTPERTRRDLRQAVSRLWKVRVEADYIPSAYIDRSIAVNAFRDANRVLLALEVEGD